MSKDDNELTIDEKLIFLFLRQFDTFVSFLIEGKPHFKESVEEYFTKLLIENRGPNGKSNTDTQTPAADLPMGFPMETTTSESSAEIE